MKDRGYRGRRVYEVVTYGTTIVPGLSKWRATTSLTCLARVHFVPVPTHIAHETELKAYFQYFPSPQQMTMVDPQNSINTASKEKLLIINV